MLERELHQLRQIIRADAFALASSSTPQRGSGQAANADRRTTAIQSGLLKRLGDVSSTRAAEAGGTHAQAKASAPGKADEGQAAAHPHRPARPHQGDRAHAGSVRIEAWRSPTLRRAAASIWSLVLSNSSQRAPLPTRPSVDRPS